MKTLKKLLCTALSLSLVLALAACGGNSSGGDAASGEVPIIGINQYGSHGSLDNCREGFLQGLQEAGLVEGTDYTIDYQNANFDTNLATQIAQALTLMGQCGVKKAVALRPITKAEAILPYLEELDLVLVMTVEPGFGGQAFMESQLDTIRQVRALIEKYNPA